MRVPRVMVTGGDDDGWTPVGAEIAEWAVSSAEFCSGLADADMMMCWSCKACVHELLLVRRRSLVCARKPHITHQCDQTLNTRLPHPNTLSTRQTHQNRTCRPHSIATTNNRYDEHSIVLIRMTRMGVCELARVRMIRGRIEAHMFCGKCSLRSTHTVMCMFIHAISVFTLHIHIHIMLKTFQSIMINQSEPSCLRIACVGCSAMRCTYVCLDVIGARLIFGVDAVEYLAVIIVTCVNRES